MLRVIDNFLPIAKFEELKEKSKNAEYKTVEVQMRKYHGISVTWPMTPLFLGIFERDTGLELEPVISFFREYKDMVKPSTWIHSDAAFADYIAILFIEPSVYFQDDAVALWKYKSWDSHYMPELLSKGLTQKVDSHTFDPELWTMWKRIEFKYNRMVFFPANWFHSKATLGVHGRRIVHVSFFNQRISNKDQRPLPEHHKANQRLLRSPANA